MYSLKVFSMSVIEKVFKWRLAQDVSVSPFQWISGWSRNTCTLSNQIQMRLLDMHQRLASGVAAASNAGAFCAICVQWVVNQVNLQATWKLLASIVLRSSCRAVEGGAWSCWNGTPWRCRKETSATKGWKICPRLLAKFKLPSTRHNFTLSLDSTDI